MRCELCKIEINEGALACPRCGSPVARPAGGTEPPAAQPAPTPGPPPAPEPPPDVPLAPLEEDFIAMADDSAIEAAVAKKFGTAEAPPQERADVSGVAEQSIPPGAPIPSEPVRLDTSDMTGGYKGPEGPSVSGAGAQTADDPFGLEIRETAPPSVAFEEEESRWNKVTIVNWTVTIVIILAAMAAAGIGIYYGFLSKSKPGELSPQGTVQEFFTYAAGSDYSRAATITTSTSSMIPQAQTVLKPFENMGTIDIKKLETKKENQSATNATVVVTNFEIKVTTEKGSELFDVLAIEKPIKLPTTINLIKQGDKWFIN